MAASSDRLWLNQSRRCVLGMSILPRGHWNVPALATSSGAAQASRRVVGVRGVRALNPLVAALKPCLRRGMSTLTIISRADAKALGLTHYFTGKACFHAHACARLVSNKNCVECKREDQRSPEGRDARRRYRQSPKGCEVQRRYDHSPKGRERERRRGQTSKRRDAERKRRCTPAYHEKVNAREREQRLDRALDTTQPNYNPARAALLLARAHARQADE